jgi:hypothetical protein
VGVDEEPGGDEPERGGAEDGDPFERGDMGLPLGRHGAEQADDPLDGGDLKADAGEEEAGEAGPGRGGGRAGTAAPARTAAARSWR